MKYINVTQLSERWGVTPRYIQNLCRSGQMPEAVRMGKIWMLPEDVKRPVDKRYKSTVKEERQIRTDDEVCWSVIGAAYRIPGTEDELIKSLANTPEAELTKAQFAYLHGDIDICAELSKKLFDSSDDFEIKEGSAFLMNICAMYNGNVTGWRNTKKLIENLPCPDGYEARKELWLAIIGASIYDMSEYPEWFRRGCFDPLPSGYLSAAYLHYVKYLYILGDATVKHQPPDEVEFNGQLFLLPAICEPLISVAVRDKAVISEIYLRLLCASGYHHAGKDSLAVKHIERALTLAIPDDIYAPFIEQRLNLDSLIDDLLRTVSVKAFDKVRAMNTKLMQGWSVIHNTVLNRSHTTALTPKELEAARLAAFGLTNSEIAKRMGISVNSVKAYLQVAKDKTGVKKRTELAKFV